jgi:hypothetical protein
MPPLPTNAVSARCPPSGVQKECQHIIHFIAHNEVYKMEDLNDEQRKNKLFLLVHGNGDDEDLLSLNTLFLCGRKQFESVFDREIIE